MRRAIGLRRASYRKARSVLDAGCGSGYGAAELAQHARTIALDVSQDAIAHARQNFPHPRTAYLQATCEMLPFADASFDLVTSFEVIEHLPRWPELVAQARRVLKSNGVFLVSTPNKTYYEESRAEAGPNPFHSHEFEYAEFRTALEAVFPHVRIWTQNHAEAIVFAPHDPATRTLEANGDNAPETANFFVAACSESPILQNELFAWLPSTANLLREREHHIGKLEGELAKKDAWLNRLIDDHATLKREHDATLAELAQRADWNQALNTEIAERRARIAELQDESAQRLEWVRATEAEAHRLEGEIKAAAANIERLENLVKALHTDLAAREAWGQSLNVMFHEKAVEVQKLWEEVQILRPLRTELDLAWQQLQTLREERALIAASRWVRLGRKLNIGPAVDGV